MLCHGSVDWPATFSTEAEGVNNKVSLIMKRPINDCPVVEVTHEINASAPSLLI